MQRRARRRFALRSQINQAAIVADAATGGNMKEINGQEYAELLSAFIAKDWQKIFTKLARLAQENFQSSKIQSVANMTPAQIVHRVQSLGPAQDAALSTVLHILKGRPL